MKEYIKQEKGITLVALVLTIIVLLVLASISITVLNGENGIVTKAKTAKEETERAGYKEELDLIGIGLQSEKTIEQLSKKEYMDRYQSEIENSKKFVGATITRQDDKTIQIITKEGYDFLLTEDKTIEDLKAGEYVNYVDKNGATENLYCII